MSDIDPRDFGRLEAKVEELGRGMAALAEQLATVNATLNEARGGWRVLLMVGGAGATLSGVVSWLLHNWPFRS